MENNNVEISYYEHFNGQWDSYLGSMLIVKNAKNLKHAQVMTELLVSEEYEGDLFISREHIVYYKASKL